MGGGLAIENFRDRRRCMFFWTIFPLMHVKIPCKIDSFCGILVGVLVGGVLVEEMRRVKPQVHTEGLSTPPKR